MTSFHQDFRRQLLAIARAAIAADLFGANEDPPGVPFADVPTSGVFVTLRKFGRLRGCIGTFSPHGSLVETIRRMAPSAARDPRFLHQPISAAELKDLSIEISILSPLEPIAQPLELELGRHGIFIRRGALSGCFLPDVATERGWDAATFLSNCCEQKAGLAPNAWRMPGTDVFVFTVEKVHCD